MTRWSRDDSDGILKSVDDSQPSSSRKAGAANAKQENIFWDFLFQNIADESLQEKEIVIRVQEIN